MRGRCRHLLLGGGTFFLAVLGLDGWREIEKPHSTKVLQDVLAALMASGAMTRRPLPVVVAVLRGAINEAAMVVAENPTSSAVRAETGELIDALLDGLRAPRKRTTRKKKPIERKKKMRS